MPWFEVRPQKPADGKVRLLEVSLYAKKDQGSAMCAVTWHSTRKMPKIPSRYTWNNRAHGVRDRERK